nr:CRISPR-associated DxTHG motif protein [Pyrobaculum sp.]
MLSGGKRVIGIAALGQFLDYKPVTYRVYKPSAKGRESRAPVRICANFGPLAVTYALTAEANSGEFNLLLFTPITLTAQRKDNEEIGYEKLKTLEEYGERVMESLLGKIKESEECKTDPSAVKLQIQGLGKGEPSQFSCSEKKSLPCEVVENVDLSDGNNRWKGSLHLVLLPLVGAFRNTVFREKSEKDIGKYPEALQAAIAYGLREFARRVKSRGGTLFLDTTHGINSLTAVVTRVVTQFAPVLAFEWEIESILLYNSDPVAPGRTRDIDVSYYYQNHPISGTLRALIYDIINALNSKAKALLLLEYGLIHFALYEVKYREKCNTHEIQIIVEPPELQEKGIYIVNYKIPFNISLYEIAYDWLLNLIESKIVEPMWCRTRSGANCLSYAGRRLCIDLEYIMSALKYEPEEGGRGASGDYCQSDEEKIGCELLRELIPPMARLVWFYEYDQFKDNPGLRLQYLAPGVLKSGEDKSLCERINNKCIQVLIPQARVRNVVAHAGLTGAAYGMAFIFELKEEKGNPDSKKECRLRYVCVAESYPKTEELLKYIK